MVSHDSDCITAPQHSRSAAAATPSSALANSAVPSAMSTPAPSRSPHASSSSSTFSSPMQRCPRFQLLQGLPASLVSEICSFLSVYQVVSTLRSTCHAMHGSVTPTCLQRSHLVITGRSLPSLVVSSSSTRALVSRVPSLTIFFRYGKECKGSQDAMLALHRLRSPLDASRFLFASLASLHVNFCYDGRGCPPLLRQSCLLSALLLLAANAQSLSSLRCLHIDDSGMTTAAALDLPFSSLPRLPALIECRIDLSRTSASSCSALLSALSSQPFLTALDLHDGVEAWPTLLPALCEDGATPLLLRLKSLLLPRHCRMRSTDRLYDAFLCRLSSLPAPPVLERFQGVHNVSHRAAGLRSIFSLPHLTQLDLHGLLWPTELCAFAVTFSSAPAPLVSLTLPFVQRERDDDGRDEAAVREDEVAICYATRVLLSRFTTLRRLCCEPEMASALALSDSTAGDGCCSSLYRLTVRLHNQLSRFAFTPFIPPPSFSLLTQLKIELPMTDAQLELLLPACPQLLRLNCVASEGWTVVLIAARWCHCLLDLTVSGGTEDRQLRDAASAAPQLVASPFLPQLIALRLYGGLQRRPPFESDSSVLRHFTAPPHAQLRLVYLEGCGLPAHAVLSLSSLPLLAYLHASGRTEGVGEVEEATKRMRLQLMLTYAAGRADRDDTHRPRLRRGSDGIVDESPLGPHQQQEMRQRVLDEAAGWRSMGNVLESIEAVDAETARALFFAELQTAITAAAARSVGNEEEGGAAASLCRQ